MNKFKKFLKNTSGNIATITGLLALPLFASAGIAVDYSNFNNLRTTVQSALDASGLAAGAQMADGVENAQELGEYAEDFFEANIPGDVAASEYEFNFEFLPAGSPGSAEKEHQLRISARVNYDTYFGDLIGVPTLAESLTSIISLGNRTVEVALVLDNSGSMRGRRINSLRTESKKLVETVFNSSNLIDIEDPVQFSVVPFAGTINVGDANENATWMDTRGWSPVHHENLDWEATFRSNNNTRVQNIDGLNTDFQENVNGIWEDRTRFDVFSMLNTQWGGCVEMRPFPHNILDTAADSTQNYRATRDSVDADNDGNGDGTSALFVPYFWPDTPDSRAARRFQRGNNLYNFARNTRHRNDSGFYVNNYLYDFNDFDPSNPNGPGIQLYTNDNIGSISPANGAINAASVSPFDSTVTTPQRGNRNQVNRTNWVFKYQSNRRFPGTAALSDSYGPNRGCTVDPITPLTAIKNDINQAIDDMDANGTTNIQQGLTWGWRTLTPAQPFTGGRDNVEDDTNLKIIILLTDGNNFYGSDAGLTPNNTAYGAWGYGRLDTNPLVNPHNDLPTHSRWLEGLENDDLADTIYQGRSFPNRPDQRSEYELIMNAHTNQACRNIKNDGVTIYAVAFGVPSNGGVRDLLRACAGSGKNSEGEEIIKNSKFLFDIGNNELNIAFADIARQISNLRVAQ